MTAEAMCRCGHAKRRHQAWKGVCMSMVDGLDDPFAPLPAPGKPWKACWCKAYDDSALPASGERLEFGTHRLRSDEAETAVAWPSMATFAARVKAATTRRLRALR